MTGAIDPRWPFASCDGSIETQGPAVGVSQAVAATAESGIAGPDAAIRFGKAADPLDAAKSCYVMTRKQGDETTLNRTELSFSTTYTPIPLGAACWIAFAVRIPQEWMSAVAGDETMLFQVHDSPDGGDDTQPAPIGLVVSGAAARLWVRANPNAVTLSGATTDTVVWSEAQWPVDVWQYFAIRLQCHWDSAQSPRLEVWRRVNGTTTKLVDYSGPNSYNNTARDYAKSGLYYYDGEWSGGMTVRTMHHKGLYQWLDADVMSAESILDFLGGI